MLTQYKSILAKLKLMGFAVAFGFCTFQTCSAQVFELPKNQKRQSIPFKLIRNLIVVPVMINGKGPFDFILDTGVGPMIITDREILDSLVFDNAKKITIAGLGIDTLVAYLSQSITAKVGRAEIIGIPTAILAEDLFNISGYLGTKIYGILGFAFFNSFVVDIRYSQHRLIVTRNGEPFKVRGKKELLEIDNMRPYLHSEIMLDNGTKVRAKFLIDTGASHALSMEMLDGSGFPLPKVSVPAYLGMSISGRIKGRIGRIAQVNLGGYDFKNVVSGFPDYNLIVGKIAASNRNGNLGAELLRRFDLQINYSEGAIYLKPNINRKKPFSFNRVGAAVYQDSTVNSKQYLITDIDEDSPAKYAGLKSGDEIVGINFIGVDKFSLDQIIELFKSPSQRTIVLKIFRNGAIIYTVIECETRI